MTAWVPFAVFLFGIHELAAIFLIAFGSFFPIVVDVAAGARQTPRILIRAARMLGTPPRKLLLRVVLPAALPSIFTGLRVGLGLAWVLSSSSPRCWLSRAVSVTRCGRRISSADWI